MVDFLLYQLPCYHDLTTMEADEVIFFLISAAQTKNQTAEHLRNIYC